MSRKLLESAGYRVEWHEYPMEHSVWRAGDRRHQLMGAPSAGR